MPAPKEEKIEISVEDLVETLTAQRNDAMNELARVTAALRTLQRRQGNGAIPEKAHDTRGVPTLPSH
jgi:hypothetical protein